MPQEPLTSLLPLPAVLEAGEQTPCSLSLIPDIRDIWRDGCKQKKLTSHTFGLGVPKEFLPCPSLKLKPFSALTPDTKNFSSECG